MPGILGIRNGKLNAKILVKESSKLGQKKKKQWGKFRSSCKRSLRVVDSEPARSEAKQSNVCLLCVSQIQDVFLKHIYVFHKTYISNNMSPTLL